MPARNVPIDKYTLFRCTQAMLLHLNEEEIKEAFRLVFGRTFEDEVKQAARQLGRTLRRVRTPSYLAESFEALCNEIHLIHGRQKLILRALEKLTSRVSQLERVIASGARIELLSRLLDSETDEEPPEELVEGDERGEA